MHGQDDDERDVVFGPFVLSPRQRTLSEDGAPVHLRGREFELLKVLVSNAGQFMTNDDLLAHVWPSTIVGETNLRVQIASLRRALGDGRGNMRYIVNVAGRGYCFTATTQLQLETIEPRRHDAPSGYPLNNLPVRLKSTVGRVEASHRLLAHLPQRRLVTIVGPGGVGKTTVALGVAEQAKQDYRDGVLLIDLSSLSDGRLIPAAIAATLGMTVVSADPLDEVVRHIQTRQLLLVIDNCEHVIAGAAAVIERILRGAASVKVLATSREPLRIEGEWLFRLAPLEIPPLGLLVTAENAIAYSAVQLFVARAYAVSGNFKLTDANAPAVADLCRRLDGNPLAVELAAARTEIYGLANLADPIGDLLEILNKGPRNAVPRHQTLRATLDWSYRLLSQDEQTVLNRLSVFRGEFDVAGALAVATAGDVTATAVRDALDELTGKSLLAVETGRGSPHYKLFFLMRSFIEEKLAAAEAVDDVLERHARHCLLLLTEDERRYSNGAHPETVERHRRQIDDVRAALDWSFSEAGDTELALQLTAAAVRPGLRLSLLQEHGEQIDRALDRARDAGADMLKLRLQMLIERVNMMHHTDADPAKIAAWTAEIQDIVFHNNDEMSRAKRAGALAMAFGQAFSFGDSPALVKAADSVLAVAMESPVVPELKITGHRMRAQAMHFMGDHLGSKALIDQVLTDATETVRSPTADLFADLPDPQVTLRIFKARTAWLQGRVVEASEVAEQAEALAAVNYAHVHCYALAFASCPVALWRGDVSLARRHANKLSEITAAHPLEYWRLWASHYQHVVTLLDTQFVDEAYIEQPEIDPQHADHLGTFHPSLIGTLALRRVREGLSPWSAPELTRAHAETSVERGSIDAPTAIGLFEGSLEMARRHGALSWELRAATSLARIRSFQGQTDFALGLLGSVLDRFTEGFEDDDFIKAESLLTRLAER